MHIPYLLHSYQPFHSFCTQLKTESIEILSFYLIVVFELFKKKEKEKEKKKKLYKRVYLFLKAKLPCYSRPMPSVKGDVALMKLYNKGDSLL
jgi:hypothetical protein